MNLKPTSHLKHSFQKMFKRLDSIIKLLVTTEWICKTLIGCVTNNIFRSSQNSIFLNPSI